MRVLRLSCESAFTTEMERLRRHCFPGEYLFAFRNGHPLSTLMLTTVVCVAIILLVIGHIEFGERLTVCQWAGVVLCLVGIALIKLRSQVPTDQRPAAG